MSFKRKIWKRGDKLNAKELNRIEAEIEELKTSSSSTNSDSNTIVITCNLTQEQPSDVSLTVSNLSHNGAEVENAILTGKDITIKANFNNDIYILKLNYFDPYFYENNTYIWNAQFICNYISSSQLKTLKLNFYDDSLDMEGNSPLSVACVLI